MMNCHEIRCPFESICRNRDIYTDRTMGCTTREFIIGEAQKVAFSTHGMSKIQMVKVLRDETGASLRTCLDALERGGDLVKAKDYILHGW